VKASLAHPAINTGDAAGDLYTSVANLTGSRFDDTLIGDDQPNRITGSLGSDVLTGGGGTDIFVFDTTSDSSRGSARDKIVDFHTGDKIDLSAIDAKTGPGNQTFSFIGTAAFTNTKGELRVRKEGSSA